MSLVPAHTIVHGNHVGHPAAGRIRVLASYPDVGAGSGSATTWCVEGYPAPPDPSGPTCRIRGAPEALVEVLE